MTPEQIVAGVVGLAVIGWPYIPAATTRVTGLWKGLVKPRPHNPVEAVTPSYSHALESLATVRSRLKATSRLNEAQTKAVEVLTLALVAGSDK